jgi:ligand-binding sensor domain-containing protein
MQPAAQPFGPRWQSAAATPFFDCAPGGQSGVALRFPPQSKSWWWLRAAARLLVGFVVVLPSFGATTILDPAHVAREFTQRSWQKKDGLPDNEVQALLQTRDGYLWIGTRRGLARFDGLRFVVFDHLNTPEMPDDNCKSLTEDTEGNLWIATDDGLLRCREGRFKRFTRKDGLASLPDEARDRIWMVQSDRSGGVWAGTLCLVLLQNGRIQEFG